MSTQHPDNVITPFFASSQALGGEDEVIEAYYTLSHLGCDEQMWDCEGKEFDNFLVRKLLTQYESFFRENQIGDEVRITLRVPNPAVEKAEAKILLETLESIPRSFDAATLFYGNEIPPIFEVILPMATDAIALERIRAYYKDFVIGKENKPIRKGDITVGEWIGDFKPKDIHVIPLFEDKEHLLNAANVTREFLKNQKVPYQRVFLARSDPAMNYGMISAVMLNKIALQRLQKLSEEVGIPICPIIGAGSAPFRGNLRPDNTQEIAKEYASAYTFTVQSAFKYDYEPDEVRSGVEILKNRDPEAIPEIEEEKCLEILERYAAEYQKQVMQLAPLINNVSKFVPKRRKRKLHIGLFGYARDVKGVTLPRAISFTASLYSLGIPPEILGLNALTMDDIRFLDSVYLNLVRDLKDALRFCNLEAKFLPDSLREYISNLPFGVQSNEEHASYAKVVEQAVSEGATAPIQEAVLRAAHVRRFLG
ncbi:MAG: phosphoenolpyruvate carboxylase [Candidatus Hydrogenedentota bacterium]|nr:MAG: phosphoenolpyruvate carboxylase [Candidatus Hydrogenedentota bacterium]